MLHLLQVNEELLTDLIAGRSRVDDASFDCKMDATVVIWGVVPFPKTLHSVTNLGGSSVNSGATHSSGGHHMSTRLLDHGFTLPNMHTVGMYLNSEITFHSGHALNLVIAAIAENTNTFKLIMPEARYRINANVSGAK